METLSWVHALTKPLNFCCDFCLVLSAQAQHKSGVDGMMCTAHRKARLPFTLPRGTTPMRTSHTPGGRRSIYAQKDITASLVFAINVMLVPMETQWV